MSGFRVVCNRYDGPVAGRLAGRDRNYPRMPTLAGSSVFATSSAGALAPVSHVGKLRLSRAYAVSVLAIITMFDLVARCVVRVRLRLHLRYAGDCRSSFDRRVMGDRLLRLRRPPPHHESLTAPLLA